MEIGNSFQYRLDNLAGVSVLHSAWTSEGISEEGSEGASAEVLHADVQLVLPLIELGSPKTHLLVLHDVRVVQSLQHLRLVLHLVYLLHPHPPLLYNLTIARVYLHSHGFESGFADGKHDEAEASVAKGGPVAEVLGEAEVRVVEESVDHCYDFFIPGYK